MSITNSKRTMEKRRHILDAARNLILRNGLRGTTMEAIAKEARVAKPTLYKHFSDKDAVFSAILSDLAVAKSRAFKEGFEEAGDIRKRVAGGLAKKFGLVAEVLEASPHANELIGAHHRMARPLRVVDEAIAEQIAEALQEAGFSEAQRLTEVILAACSGILSTFQTAAAVREAVTMLCLQMLKK
ncbi:TetR/AcrR family transcriptional regulator [Pelagibacterium lentulum]|uniref:HTH tetR-type domain-containing protein n=1 Tax=Pelagibacterium lentulum TaxID=2029865 RepID=A0A916W059_9HYPH|nr:TetR/AcrR family transcriptional regulator [Pelagibacterium lentulum]GGA55664.1 hypothetical protein GCM10011499_27240 [Pelagibacterium lentulum]